MRGEDGDSHCGCRCTYMAGAYSRYDCILGAKSAHAPAARLS